MKVEIVRTYEHCDTERDSDAAYERLFIDGVVVSSGNWQQGIQHKFDGWLECLQWLNVVKPEDINIRDENESAEECNDLDCPSFVCEALSEP